MVTQIELEIGYLAYHGYRKAIQYKQLKRLAIEAGYCIGDASYNSIDNDGLLYSSNDLAIDDCERKYKAYLKQKGTK